MVAPHFFFLFEMIIDNMYIIYFVHLKNSRERRTPMSYLQFKANLCEALLDSWKMRNFIPKEDGIPPYYCIPSHSIVRKPCEVFFPQFYCHHCGNK
jgi:hypothetical protein